MDASIARYSDFESVGRLRRRAFGGKGALPIHEMAEWGITKSVPRYAFVCSSIALDRRVLHNFSAFPNANLC